MSCLTPLLFFCAIPVVASAQTSIQELKTLFRTPPADSRIMMRWWWFGPAVSTTELEREMRTMKEGGIGGFEVQPVYPLELEGNTPYLSPEFLAALKFTGQKARELGLRMDLTLGSGWPFGGPNTPITLAAGRLRVERVPVPPNTDTVAMPKIGEGEKFVAAFLARGDGGDPITDIEGGVIRLGKRFDDRRVVLVFIASRTKQMVKRAAAGAEGYVLDHYDRAAIDAHLEKVGEPMLRALAATPPHAVFSDSLEVYNSDWTVDFLAEFQKRRGYDLTPYLPALAGDIGLKTAAIRHDWGKTLTELAEERYLTPLREWAHRHGTLLRSQTYGIPPVELSSNALVDLPEGEGAHWREFTTSRWASSGSHLYDRPVTSSETWTWLHSPVFRATPLDMKAEADMHFLEGINQLIGHGWPYSPPGAGEPGWRFYAAAVFNQHNPWWIVMPDIALYLQRMSFLLRQGRPVADVALYLPTDDAWARFTLGRDSLNQTMAPMIGDLVSRVLDAGYALDFIDDTAIEKGGVRYPILILPGIERMPLATLKRLDEYRKRGGVVVALRHVPSLSPGLHDENDTPMIRDLARTFPVTEDARLADTLHAALAPDVAIPAGLGFVHRKLPFAEVYFVANPTNHAVRGTATFRVTGLEGWWWNPMTGAMTGAGGPQLDLDLAPYESRVIVFSKDRIPVEQPGGKPETIDLSSGWKIQFAGAGDATPLTPLRSWTELEGRKYFSGTATYERNVTVTEPGRKVYLDFGEGTPVLQDDRRAGPGIRAMLEGPVREAAVVYVNGKRAGSVWCSPYRVELTGLLRAGENEIRVVVANLAVNLLAKGPLPDYQALNARYGERFQAQDMKNLQPQPSGLLGPIRLLFH